MSQNIDLSCMLNHSSGQKDKWVLENASNCGYQIYANKIDLHQVQLENVFACYTADLEEETVDDEEEEEEEEEALDEEDKNNNNEGDDADDDSGDDDEEEDEKADNMDDEEGERGDSGPMDESQEEDLGVLINLFFCAWFRMKSIKVDSITIA